MIQGPEWFRAVVVLGSFYRAARLSSKGFADRAVAALAEAVEAGWAQPAELREPDFDAVRDRADFRTLWAEVEARAAAVDRGAPPPGPATQ